MLYPIGGYMACSTVSLLQFLDQLKIKYRKEDLVQGAIASVVIDDIKEWLDKFG